MGNVTKPNNDVGVLSGDLFVCGLVIKKEELAVDYELVRMTPQEVDSLNVFQARMEGFKRAISILSKRTGATYAIIDGNKKPEGLLIETDV